MHLMEIRWEGGVGERGRRREEARWGRGGLSPCSSEVNKVNFHARGTPVINFQTTAIVPRRIRKKWREL